MEGEYTIVSISPFSLEDIIIRKASFRIPSLPETSPITDVLEAVYSIDNTSINTLYRDGAASGQITLHGEKHAYTVKAENIVDPARAVAFVRRQGAPGQLLRVEYKTPTGRYEIYSSPRPHMWRIHSIIFKTRVLGASLIVSSENPRDLSAVKTAIEKIVSAAKMLREKHGALQRLQGKTIYLKHADTTLDRTVTPRYKRMPCTYYTIIYNNTDIYDIVHLLLSLAYPEKKPYEIDCIVSEITGAPPRYTILKNAKEIAVTPTKPGAIYLPPEDAVELEEINGLFGITNTGRIISIKYDYRHIPLNEIREPYIPEDIVDDIKKKAEEAWRHYERIIEEKEGRRR